jgi:hypothetical protein
MKIIIIIAATLFFLCAFYLRSTQSSHIKKYANELIDSLLITSDNVTFCKQSNCIESMKTEMKTNRNFVVIYKDREKWRVVRDRKKKIRLIDAYTGSNLILWQGNTTVRGIDLDNQETVLVLN